MAHLRDALLYQDYSGPAIAEMRQFIEQFYSIVSPGMPQKTEAGKRLAVTQVWAAIFNFAMLPELFGLPLTRLTGEEMVAPLGAALFDPH